MKMGVPNVFSVFFQCVQFVFRFWGSLSIFLLILVRGGGPEHPKIAKTQKTLKNIKKTFETRSPRIISAIFPFWMMAGIMSWRPEPVRHDAGWSAAQLARQLGQLATVAGHAPGY